MAKYYPEKGDKVEAIYTGSNSKYKQKYLNNPFIDVVTNVIDSTTESWVQISFKNHGVIKDYNDWTFTKLKENKMKRQDLKNIIKESIKQILKEDEWYPSKPVQTKGPLHQSLVNMMQHDLNEKFGDEKHEYEITEILTTGSGDNEEWFITTRWYDWNTNRPKSAEFICPKIKNSPDPDIFERAPHGWPVNAKSIYTLPEEE